MLKKLSSISSNFSDWYNDIVIAAELAEHSVVRGALVIRPYGCALWENIRNTLDSRIKKTGHQNALFPLFIPQSFLAKEAAHVEGFAPEVAVVTHAGGKQLEEPYIVRPTSETIVHYHFAHWIRSWRDLPLKINQWANVVRWEMRPRAFVRTTEIFWQEGHTAHATEHEAHEHAQLMLTEYESLCYQDLAIPIITGTKPAHERFPGAAITYTIEGIMGDGKALQMGTSHLLSQTFAQAFDMTFQNKDGHLSYPWLTSWGVTTRLIGALIMVHGDQKGLIMPPRIAPYQVVIIPIITARDHAHKENLDRAVLQCQSTLENAGIRVIVDQDLEKSPGAKFYHWEMKGVPLRIEIGMRDIDKKEVVVVNRLTGEKKGVPCDNIATAVSNDLTIFHEKLLSRAMHKRTEQWHHVDKIKNSAHQLEQHGGIYQTGWCGQSACALVIKDMKGTIRCYRNEHTQSHCTVCTAQSTQDVLIAKAY